MARLCERPGCSQPAEVSYGINPDGLVVWIACLDPAWPDRPGVLCRRHADAMIVPVRWTLDDRREPVPRLFRVGAPVAPTERDSEPRTPSRKLADAEQLVLESQHADVVDADGTG